MKTKLLFLILILFFCTAKNFSQEIASYRFEFLPSGLNFMPLKANHREARIGVLYHTATTNLKVDIGNNIDLFALNFPVAESKLTAAIEFMAYALSTSYNGNRLQIDAVDGFFGGNISYTEMLGEDKFIARLRIIHNSAHFVDGHYDLSAHKWIDDREPIPYTEDFGELTLGQVLNYSSVSFKYFGGFSYSTLVRPSDLKRYNFHIGFELAFPDLLGKIVNQDCGIFVANYISTHGTAKYILNQQTMLGVKLGNWESKGIILYASYYSGGDIFGSYYNQRISKFGIGFSVDFP